MLILFLVCFKVKIFAIKRTVAQIFIKVVGLKYQNILLAIKIKVLNSKPKAASV